MRTRQGPQSSSLTRYSGSADSGSLSYVHTPAIAAALGTAIVATIVTAIADGDLLCCAV